MDIFNWKSKNNTDAFKQSIIENEDEGARKEAMRISNVISNGRIVVREDALTDKRKAPIALDKASQQRLSKIGNNPSLFASGNKSDFENARKSEKPNLWQFAVATNLNKEGAGNNSDVLVSKFGENGGRTSSEASKTFKIEEGKQQTKKSWFGFFSCCFR